MPQVFLCLKSPLDSNKFNEFQVDDMKVFVKKDLILDEEVRIKYPKYASDLSGREFEVVGAIPPTL